MALSMAAPALTTTSGSGLDDKKEEVHRQLWSIAQAQVRHV